MLVGETRKPSLLSSPSTPAPVTDTVDVHLEVRPNALKAIRRHRGLESSSDPLQLDHGTLCAGELRRPLVRIADSPHLRRLGRKLSFGGSDRSGAVTQERALYDR